MASTSIDISNWRQPPNNAWSFRNIDNILSTHTIEKGSGQKKLLEKSPDSSNILEAFKLQSGDEVVFDWRTFLEFTHTDGIVILKEGRIVYENYFHGNDADSRHILMSVSKSITGLLAGILKEQGKLDVDAPVTKYVPEMRDTSLENATVQQCLDMRSNIQYADGTHDYRMAAGWNPTQDDEAEQTLHGFLSNLHAEPPPKVDGLDGAPFSYTSVNTDLMGWILERAAGTDETFAQLLSRLLWQPMGAEKDAFVTVDRAGAARAAGGICTTVRDLARLGLVVVDNGAGIVPADWIEDMSRDGSHHALSHSTWMPMFEGLAENPAYRSYWSADPDIDIFMGIGIHGQHLFVDRKNKIVLAKTSSHPSDFDFPMMAGTVKAFAEIRRIFTS